MHLVIRVYIEYFYMNDHLHMKQGIVFNMIHILKP